MAHASDLHQRLMPFVRSVAEQHAGSIAVECRHGFTTFILDTPIDPRPILSARARG